MKRMFNLISSLLIGSTGLLSTSLLQTVTNNPTIEKQANDKCLIPQGEPVKTKLWVSYIFSLTFDMTANGIKDFATMKEQYKTISLPDITFKTSLNEFRPSATGDVYTTKDRVWGIEQWSWEVKDGAWLDGDYYTWNIYSSAINEQAENGDYLLTLRYEAWFSTMHGIDYIFKNIDANWGNVYIA